MRGNKSFNNTVTGVVQSSIITPKVIKRKTKLDLKRYASNQTLAQTHGNLKTGLQNFNETTSQVSSIYSTAVHNPLNLALTRSNNNSPSKAAKKNPFSYPLPPKNPAGIPLNHHQRHRSSLFSNQSSAICKTEKVSLERNRSKTPFKRKQSFVDTFNERYYFLDYLALGSRSIRLSRTRVHPTKVVNSFLTA